MITQLFDTLSDVVTGGLSVIISAVSGITDLFYTTADGFTTIGQLLLLGLGLSFAFFGWRVVKALIKR